MANEGFPEDSMQSFAETEWWVEDKDKKIHRGSLVHVYVPHVDQIPYRLIPEGRREPTQHDSAIVKIEALYASGPRKPQLPVAAMPCYGSESYLTYRGKRRPALVLGIGGPTIERNLRGGSPKSQTNQTMTVVPYYGVDGRGSAGGWEEILVEKIRHCTFPQYLYDQLPHNGSKPRSVLRLDHAQPIGTHHQSYGKMGFKLSEEALGAVDEYFLWCLTGCMDEEGWLYEVRSLLQDEFESDE